MLLFKILTVLLIEPQKKGEEETTSEVKTGLRLNLIYEFFDNKFCVYITVSFLQE